MQAHAPGHRTLLLNTASATPHAWAEGELQAAVARLLPAPVARIDTLQAYDTYYYTRAPHTMGGSAEKPLPVLRVVFDDPQASWVHVDPHTGTVLNRVDRHRRVHRWLFGMLHSWDWMPLLSARPLWDMVLIVLSLGGLAISLTGIMIGWRRVGLKMRRSRKGRPATPPKQPEIYSHHALDGEAPTSSICSGSRNFSA